jgi:hypothetical protein
LFLVTFPISLPAWFAILVLVVVTQGLHFLLQPLIHFWTAPPKQRHGSYYGVRRKPPENAARIIKIHDRKAA